MARLEKIPVQFAWLPNPIVNDPNLSWKAKGILLYLNSKPVGWKFKHKDLQKRATDGAASAQTGINECKAQGYLEIEAEHTPEGKVKEWVWRLDLTPHLDNQDEPDADNPDLDNRHSSKTVKSKTVTTIKEAETQKLVSDAELVFSAEEMHTILCTETALPLDLTDKRTQLYSNFWTQHLLPNCGLIPPLELWRRVVIEVAEDEYLKGDKQEPDYFLVNQDWCAKRIRSALDPSFMDGRTVATATGYTGRQPWL